MDDCVLLVHNRRNNGGSDWTTPGGVIDPGETLLEGLTREVSEETGLAVAAWRGPVYTVVAEAPDMDWRLSVEAHHSTSHNGELSVDDPDGIVFDADWVPLADVEARLDGSQLWFTEPLLEYLATLGGSAGDGTPGDGTPGSGCPHFSYVVKGTDRRDLRVERR